MKANLKYFILLFVAVLLFFWPIFKGQIPFPGDLLVGFYEPYKAYPILNYPPGGVPSKAQGTDVARHIFPWKHFVIESYKKGELPFWNPHNFSGNPQLANFQTGAFYPFNLLFLILPFLMSWTIYILLVPILSSFFMYLFLRELKLSNLSSFFAGILFAFSSFMVVWMEYGNIGHTFLWLPLCLLWTERFINRPKHKYIIYLILTFVMSILAGSIQTNFYLVSTVFFYFIVKGILNKSLTLKNLSLFLAIILFSFLFSLFQILPTIELFSNSSRGSYTLSQIENLLNPWWYTITAIIPNFFGNPASNNHWFYGTYIERVSYIGLIPLIFALYAAFNFRKRKEVLIFGTLSLFALIIATDLFITKYFYRLPIPVISTTVPTRILSLFQFAMVILSAIGFDYFRKNFNKKSLNLSIFLIFTVLLISWIFAFSASNFLKIDPINLAVTKKNLLIPTGLILSFIIVTYFWFKLKARFILVGILLLTILDLFYFFHRITPFSAKEFIYPETPVINYIKENGGIYRFWGYGSGYIESDFQTFDKTYSPEGVDPLHIIDYTKLLSSSKNGKILKDLPRPDANLAPGYGKEDLRNNQYRQRLLNLLGIKFITHKTGSLAPDNETFSVGNYDMVFSDGYYQIYENKETLPRIFLASNYLVERNQQKIVDKIYDSSLDLRKTLILEEDLKPKIKLGDDQPSEVKIDKYERNKVEVSTSSKANMLLFISDTYYPEWQARVDGKGAKIYRANLAFRAVPVSAGDHKVIFEYKGDSFKKGLYISIVSFFGFVFLSYHLLKRKHVKF